MDGLFGYEISSFSHLADEDCTAAQLMLRHILHRVIFAIEKVARRRDIEGAVDDVRVVLRNLPFDPEALDYAGWVYNYCGRSEDALRCFDQMKRAVTMDFLDQLQTNGRAMALMMAGDHARASEMYIEITTRRPNSISAHMVGAASTVWAGEKERAEKAIKRVLDLSPGLTLWQMSWRPDADYVPGIRLFYDGLRKAGMPKGLEGLPPR